MAQCLAILAPSGRDAAVIQGILESAGLRASIEGSVPDVLDSVNQVRTGAVILAEEALTEAGTNRVETWLSRQPP